MSERAGKRVRRWPRSLRLFWAGWMTAWLLVAGAQTAARPNVLFLLSDDHRPDALGFGGQRLFRTPHLDRLAQRGFALTNAHIMGALQGAVCVPSRAMLLSGRTLFRCPENLQDVATWPQQLERAGYRTFITGKWHNGEASLPAHFSAGEAIFLGGMTDQFKVQVRDLGPDRRLTPPRVEARYSATLFAEAATRFLRSVPSNQPFCLYVAFTLPHDPRSAPETIRARYAPAAVRLPPNILPRHPFDNGELEVRDEKLLPRPRTPEALRSEWADYAAAVDALDAEIGRILGALEDAGHAANTVVVFAGDNGLALGSHGLLGKQNLYEHSTGVPLVIAGPGIPPGRRSNALCLLLDLAPTLCELAGVPAPPGSEGVSLVPLLQGQRQTHRDILFTAYRHVQRAVRDDRWKLIEYPAVGVTQLFDLRRDPWECRDLAASDRHRPQRERLLQQLRDAQRAAGDPLAARP